jgi:hypothetical protein
MRYSWSGLFAFDKWNKLFITQIQQTAVIFYFLIFETKPDGNFRFLTK